MSCFGRLAGDENIVVAGEPAQAMFDSFTEQVRAQLHEDAVQTGSFGEHMDVQLVRRF